jgi:CRISPR-associated protein Cst2
MKNAKALTITFLTPVSFASLNGADKETDNMSNIKKITRGSLQYPYVSSQAIRRALREQLAVLGETMSESQAATIAKGAATTACDPAKYIDDDLFGFMNAQTETVKRTAPLRVSPLVSLDPYYGDLDFGTNYMSVEKGGTPNIFETEIHSGTYRGTLLLELDRVGTGNHFTKKLENAEKLRRVKALLIAVQNLWSSGRQTRHLADISPKFLVAAILKTKNPIFLESVEASNGNLNTKLLEEVRADFAGIIRGYVVGQRIGVFENRPEGSKSIGDAFAEMRGWMEQVYGT